MAEQNTTASNATTSRRGEAADAPGSALDRARSAVEGLEANPISVLVGGLAVGLVAGALIPRSERERQMLEPVGRRLAEGAVAAVAAAKETGKEHLTASVLGKDAAKEGARAVLDSALAAARGGSRKTTSASQDRQDQPAAETA